MQLLDTLYTCLRPTEEPTDNTERKANTLMELYKDAIEEFPGLKLPEFTRFMDSQFGHLRTQIQDGLQGFHEAFYLEFDTSYADEFEEEQEQVSDHEERIKNLEERVEGLSKTILDLQEKK